MDTEKIMITVPLERYEQLIAVEARMRVLTVFTQKEVGYVAQEEIAKILGIELDAGTSAVSRAEG